MPSRIHPVHISAYTVTSALGLGKAAMQVAVEAGRSGLRRNDFGTEPLPTWIGRVDGLDTPLPGAKIGRAHV